MSGDATYGIDDGYPRCPDCAAKEAENKRLTKQIRYIEDVVCYENKFRAYPDDADTKEVSTEKVGAILQRLACHEQDIEAAFEAGRESGKLDLIGSDEAAVARFKASRKGGSA